MICSDLRVRRDGENPLSPALTARCRLQLYRAYAQCATQNEQV
jgi:hypothetical protein